MLSFFYVIAILEVAAVLALMVVLLAASTAALPGGRPTVIQDSVATSPLPLGSEPAHLDPAESTARIDNPYWPMRPGSRWVYRQTDAEGDKRIEVTVTHQTKPILGVVARVVHDVMTEDGQVKEDTYDWYAQDAQGNVWYLGEDTKQLEDGKVISTEGSWQAGVDGAQPGILLPANPKPGMAYRQEYDGAKAQDTAAPEGDGALRPLRARADHQGVHAARAEAAPARLLCARGGAGAVAHGLGRFRPGGAAEVRAGT